MASIVFDFASLRKIVDFLEIFYEHLFCVFRIVEEFRRRDKSEAAIGKIEGVQSVSVNFLTQKLTLEAPEDRFDEILELAAAACKKVDADCQVVR